MEAKKTFRILQSIISVQDCNYYNTNEVSRTSTNGSTIYDNNLSQSLPTNCEISCDVSASVVTSSSERRYFVLPKSQFSTGTSQPSNALFFQFHNSSITFGKRENGSTIGTDVISNISANTYYNIKFVRENTTIKAYVDDVLISTYTVTFLDEYSDWTLSMTRWNQSGTTTLKNVKFMAL